MVQSPGLVDRHVCESSVYPGRTGKRAAGREHTKVVKSVEHRAVLAHVDYIKEMHSNNTASELVCEVVGVLWGDVLEEIHVVICVELGKINIDVAALVGVLDGVGTDVNTRTVIFLSSPYFFSRASAILTRWGRMGCSRVYW